MIIFATVSSEGILLGHHIKHEGEKIHLSTEELKDFVDTNTFVSYQGKLEGINEYLGEGTCFSARVSFGGFNPF